MMSMLKVLDERFNKHDIVGALRYLAFMEQASERRAQQPIRRDPPSSSPPSCGDSDENKQAPHVAILDTIIILSGIIDII